MGAARSLGLGLAAACVAMALGPACANDFDGLFRAGGSDAGEDGAGGSDDGGATDPFDSGLFKCPGGTASCTKDCVRGETCKVECDVLETCTLGCTGCNATFTCKAKPKQCVITCSSRASCTASCDSRECPMKCSADSECILVCKGNAGVCDLDCQGGQKRTCPNRTFTCNRECP